MLCHYWCFKDIWFEFEPHVFNKCQDVLMSAYELNVKGVDFGANKTPVEAIKEGEFGGTKFRDFYSGVTGK